MEDQLIKDPFSTDDDRFLYVFVCTEEGMYLLYKFDAIRFFKTRVHEAPNSSPLVVFNNRILPKSCRCAFAYLDGDFFIIGENKAHVFTFSKSRISQLTPKERRRGNDFVLPCTSMLSDKLDPLAFTYEGNLYVLSRSSYAISLPEDENNKVYDFELYNPSEKSWNSLGNKPLRFSYVNAHFVRANMAYFTIENGTVLSFNLEAQTWCDVLDPFHVLGPFPPLLKSRIHPTFDTQIQMIKNKIFGGFSGRGYGYTDVCASSYLEPSDKYFLRPTLAHDQTFFTHLYSEMKKSEIGLSLWSKYFVTLDESNGIMCVVSYAGYSWDEYVNFACLSFFEVTGNSYKVPISFNDEVDPSASTFHRIFSYANDHDLANANFFEANFISTTLLPINTRKLNTVGFIRGCFFV